MKCHYIYDEISGKVLIPGCWGMAVNNDMMYCTCRRSPEKTPEEPDRIRELEQEIYKQERIIKNLLNKIDRKN